PDRRGELRGVERRSTSHLGRHDALVGPRYRRSDARARQADQPRKTHATALSPPGPPKGKTPFGCSCGDRAIRRSICADASLQWSSRARCWSRALSTSWTILRGPRPTPLQVTAVTEGVTRAQAMRAPVTRSAATRAHAAARTQARALAMPAL